jgi:hypothetical protein
VVASLFSSPWAWAGISVWAAATLAATFVVPRVHRPGEPVV